MKMEIETEMELEMAVESQCLVATCGQRFDPRPEAGWVFLTLYAGTGAPCRQGALCPRHAYCLGSMLGGELVTALPVSPEQLRYQSFEEGLLGM